MYAKIPIKIIIDITTEFNIGFFVSFSSSARRIDVDPRNKFEKKNNEASFMGPI